MGLPADIQAVDLAYPQDYVPTTQGTSFDLGDQASESAWGYEGQDINHAVANLGGGWWGDIDPGVQVVQNVGGVAGAPGTDDYSVGPTGNMDGMNYGYDKPARHVYWAQTLEGFTGPVGSADGSADVLGSTARAIASSAATTPTDDQVTAALLSQTADAFVSF